MYVGHIVAAGDRQDGVVFLFLQPLMIQDHYWVGGVVAAYSLHLEAGEIPAEDLPHLVLVGLVVGLIIYC